MALDYLEELDLTSTGDDVDDGFLKVKNNFADLDVLFNLFDGFVQRSTFRHKDDDEIYIGPGGYHHSGTSEQYLYWNTELTFQVGSGGTNSDSEDLGNNEWHYIYIDDSAVVTSGAQLLTNTEFVNNTTAPSWSADKHGWYNSNDRCIFAFFTDGTADILAFYHDNDFVLFDESIEIVAEATAVPTSFTNITPFKIPSFCRKVQATFISTWVSSGTHLFYRVDGSSATNGHRVGIVSDAPSGPTSLYATVIADVVCDSDGEIEVKGTGTNKYGVYQNGWYLTKGI